MTSFRCITAQRWVSEFVERLNFLPIKYHLSHTVESNMLSLVADALPIPNKCPASYGLRENAFLCYAWNSRRTYLHDTPRKSDRGNIIKISLLLYLKEIESGERCLSWFARRRHFSDIESGTLYLLMNTDSFSPIMSKRLHVWSIAFLLINLFLLKRRKTT